MFYPSLSTVKELAKRYNRIPVYKEMNMTEPGMLMLLKTLQADKHLVFLESSKQSGKRGRFSYLGFNPSKLLRFEEIDQKPFIFEETENTSCFTNEDIFSYIKKKIQQYRSPTYKVYGAYNGGYTGYFAYESINYTGILRNPVKKTASLPLAAFALIDDFICLDNKTGKHYLASCLYTEDSASLETHYKAVIKHLEKQEAEIIAKISQTTLPYLPSFAETLSLSFNETKDSFVKKVSKIKQLIHDGEAIQVVFSLRANISAAVDPYLFFLKLREINPSPYMFFLKLHDMSIVGSSPELHVKVDRTKVQLKPIAGTIEQGRTKQENLRNKEILLHDEKEQAEHLMLVDLGRNDLARISKAGTVNVCKFMQAEDFSHVIHLVSEVQGSLAEEKDLVDALQESFPAGTVTGAPKVRAVEIIDDFEDLARGAYSGAIGYIGFNQQADTCIAIRTAYFTKNGNYIQAGAGIVHDSIPEKEYEEIKHKLKALAVSVPFAVQKEA